MFHIYTPEVEPECARLRIGHTFFTHGWILRREDPPWCSECKCQITVVHLLVECQNLAEIRNRFLGTYSLIDIFRIVPADRICGFLKRLVFITRFNCLRYA